MKKLFLIIGLFALIQTAQAHQPRIVEDEITEVKNPEISQAFYGELDGRPELYRITMDREFELYLGILVPDIENIDKDVGFTVYKDGEILWNFDGLEHEWIYFWEEFAGDGYFDGPELRSNEKPEYPKGIMVDGGTYEIKVYSPDNIGKYVLAVGTIESFPLDETINAIKTIPKLKSDFFGKPAISAFATKFSLFIFGPIIILLATVGIIIYLVLHRKK